MHQAHFGKALRSLALFSFCLSCPLSSAFAQAHHEYAPPNPQHYQHAPVPTQLPNFEPGPDAAPQQQRSAPAQAAPNAPQRAVSQDSMGMSGNDILAFVQEHMVAIFLCMLLLAPFGAMLAMRKTEHPYDH